MFTSTQRPATDDLDRTEGARARRRYGRVLCGLLLVGVSVVGLLVACSAVTRSGAAPSLGGDEGDGDLRGARVGIDDTSLAAISGLDPDLRAAVQAATRDAADQDGIDLRITSGWRSKAYQQRLLDDAVDEYGSYEEARLWVNTPADSTHVTGEAVDIGLTDAAYWVAQHASDYGLCQTYANEIWHYELSVDPGDTCPAPR